LTLEEAVGKYSADATRIVCADSGDGLQDANFSLEMAGNTILRLTTLLEYATDIAARVPGFRRGEYTFLDRMFRNEIIGCIQRAHDGYSRMLFTDALRAAWFDVENLRSQYSILTAGDLHAEAILWSLEVQMLILSPIAPHFCEHVWRGVLGRESLVVQERWPTPEVEYSPVLARQYESLQASLRTFRLTLDKWGAGGGKKKKKNAAPKTSAKPTGAVIFVASSYMPWQQEVLRLLQDVPLDEDNSPLQKDFMRSVKDAEAIQALPKPEQKKALPFASFVMNKEVKSRGKEALELQLPFDERQMLADVAEAIKSQLGLNTLDVADAAEEHLAGGDRERAAAGPGTPQIFFTADDAAGADAAPAAPERPREPAAA